MGQRRKAVIGKFQSLSGVLGVCNAFVLMSSPPSKMRFQSLSGVLGVCNEKFPNHEKILERYVSIPFRGFRCLQHLTWQGRISIGSGVSIPFRGFRCLQPADPTKMFFLLDVSIPFRGFRCLQPSYPQYTQQSKWLFQSLSGVLGVCNFASFIISFNILYVSIPFRGFRCLQHSGFSSSSVLSLFWVSIPFRGFRCLQLPTATKAKGSCGSFQSLSGVLGVCNAPFFHFPSYLWSWFQSLSGVLGVCNSIDPNQSTTHT